MHVNSLMVQKISDAHHHVPAILKFQHSRRQSIGNCKDIDLKIFDEHIGEGVGAGGSVPWLRGYAHWVEAFTCNAVDVSVSKQNSDQ